MTDRLQEERAPENFGGNGDGQQRKTLDECHAEAQQGEAA
jgi:hypothetical protein